MLWKQFHDITLSLFSAVALTHLAIPYLQETRGNVINVSSAGAVKVVPTATYYCMTKAALDHFTRNMAQKLGEKGIRVNSLKYVIFEAASKTGF